MTNCKDCTTNCVYRGKDNEARCGSFVGTVTNADRIRAMSDEELAEFIKNIKVRAVFCKAVKNNNAFEELCSTEWLKQPFEGE